MGWIRDMVKSWLQIEPAVSQGVTILEPMAFENEVLQNRLWYRGNPSELQQFYEQTDDMIGNTAFWAARGTTGIAFRKIHSGLPALIVDTLSDIVCNDLLSIGIFGGKGQEVWEMIAKENEFERLLKRAVKAALAEGDGAFKISVDTDVSALPIVEFYEADRVRYNYPFPSLINTIERNIDSFTALGYTSDEMEKTVLWKGELNDRVRFSYKDVNRWFKSCDILTAITHSATDWAVITGNFTSGNNRIRQIIRTVN